MPATQRRILIVAYFRQNTADVLTDYLLSFKRYSRHECVYLIDIDVLDETFDFAPFDAILLFWSNEYRQPRWSGPLADQIRQATAVKMLFLQDEYREVRRFNAIMANLGIEVMFTCVAEADHQLFYPQALIPSLRRTVTVLTGYVPESLARMEVQPQTSRPVDIVYRSRSLPYWLGDLAREKVTIASRFLEIGREAGFVTDISVAETDRIYGQSWVAFLLSGRLTLGTESGASVVDFDGTVQLRTQRYLAFHPGATYEDVRANCFADIDGQAEVRAISPRVFESIALGNTLVLHEGRYSGVLVAERHFIPIRTDYSNVAEVVERMRDRDECVRIARAAQEDVVRSGSHSYNSFIALFDGVVDEEIPSKAQRPRVAVRTVPLEPPRPNVIDVIVHARAPQPKRAMAAALLARIAPMLSPVEVLRRPGHYTSKAAAVVEAVIRDPVFIALAAAGLRYRLSGGNLGMGALAEDLVKLGLLAHRSWRPGGALEFATRAFVDFGTATMLVLSYPLEDEVSDRSMATRLPRECLPDGLAGRDFKLISHHRMWRTLIDGPAEPSLVWDHSLVGGSVSYQTLRGEIVEFSVGDGDVHRFETVPDLARSCPRELVAALGPVLAS